MEPYLKQCAVLNDEIEYIEVIDRRYHINSVRADFFLPYTAENLRSMMLLSDVFPFGDPLCNTKRSEMRWAKAHYDPTVEMTVSDMGDHLMLSMHCAWLDDACALDGESVTDEVLSHLRTLLFAPECADGGCAAPEFDDIRDIAANNMEYEERDPMARFKNRINSICYRGEPSATSFHIPPAEMRRITRQDVYSMHMKMLREAQIRIAVTLAAENPAVLSWMQTQFGALARRTVPLVIESPSHIRKQPEVVREQYEDLTQSLVALVYKYGDVSIKEADYVCELLDGTTESLLFQNLREKRSLCYSCECELEHEKHTVTVTCQTDAQHIDEVTALIQEQMALIRSGSFPESLDTAIRNALTMQRVDNWDQSLGYSSYVQYRRLMGLSVQKTYEDYMHFETVSRGTAMKTAEKMILDTVYIAEGLASADGEEAADDAADI